MQITKNKTSLNKLELIYATIYIFSGMMISKLMGVGISIIVMTILLAFFTVLLIIFFRQHTYGQDKPLLTTLSIYYKTVVYLVIMFTMCNLPGRIYFSAAVLFSTVIYAALAYIFGKKYDEVLNAYLYLCLSVGIYNIYV